jgi:hypothetical protein
MSNPENVSIFFNCEDGNRILEKAGPHERYIILMNDTLQGDNRKLTKSLTDLESQIEELETDNSRMENSKTYMKGLLKNFIEITNWYKESGTIYNTTVLKMVSDFKGLKYKAVRHLRILQTIMIIFMALWFEYQPIIISLPVIGVIICNLAFQESTLYNLNICPYKTDINKISDLAKEIKNAEAAQDYIHVLIDQQ